MTLEEQRIPLHKVWFLGHYEGNLNRGHGQSTLREKATGEFMKVCNSLMLMCVGALAACTSSPMSPQQVQAAKAAVKGVAHLSWVAPTQNTDGSALLKCTSQSASGGCLRSYKVYHGTNPTRLNESATLNDRNAVTYDWGNLNKGTHYFSVSAVSGLGIESSLSPLGSIVIQ